MDAFKRCLTVLSAQYRTADLSYMSTLRSSGMIINTCYSIDTVALSPQVDIYDLNYLYALL